MRDDAPGTGKRDGEDDASDQAKAKARAAAGDHERGLVPPEADPSAQADGSAESGEPARRVKGDPAE
jgi:hypothetical protein